VEAGTAAAADWRPTAARAALELRAELLARLRAFFGKRGVLEVDTPALSAAAVTDPHIESLRVDVPGYGARWLHTSPEFPMKRLLASGSGDIYQVCKVFRGGERGRRHNPEFTLLEWYRVGIDHHALMDEVAELLAVLLGPERTTPVERTTFRDALVRHAGLDPFAADAETCVRCLRQAGIEPPAAVAGDCDALVDLITGEIVGPRLGRGGLTFVHGFPPARAALARIAPTEPPAAERFECFLDGMELANGFHELADAAEQRRRFEADLAARARAGRPQVPVDERLLAALAAGLPDCAGVALGLDRVVMLALGSDSIDDVIAFPFERA
jgi:lysyl-tRNA synthetase class 2